MTFQSLRLRLMGLAVLWVFASLLAAGLALQYLFSINIERTTREELDAALTRLAAVIVSLPDGPALSVPLPDPRYDTPFGGRYWQIELVETGQIARSRSLWDFVIDAPRATMRCITSPVRMADTLSSAPDCWRSSPKAVAIAIWLAWPRITVLSTKPPSGSRRT